MRRTLRNVWRLAQVAYIFLAGCSSLPGPETAKAEASAVACWARIHNAMKANPDCESKRAVADIIAQADANCVESKVDLSGLQCGDGGTRDH